MASETVVTNLPDEFNQNYCIKLIDTLWKIHTANSEILVFTNHRAQQANAFNLGFLLSTMYGNTLDKIIYDQSARDLVNNNAIIFKIDDNYSIQIYQLNDMAGNFLRAIHLNNPEQTFVKIDVENPAELTKYYYISDETGKPKAEGWEKKETIGTRKKGNPRYSHWTKFAGLMERYISPNENYHKYKHSGVEGSDSPYITTAAAGDVKFPGNKIPTIRRATGEGRQNGFYAICSICGGFIIEQKIDVDHCWNLRFNNLLRVIDNPVGYFDTHSNCNIGKSDKLYFPTDEVWNKLLDRAGYDEGTKEIFQKFKTETIDKPNYPKFILGKTLKYESATTTTEEMDILYLKRLNLTALVYEGEKRPITVEALVNEEKNKILNFVITSEIFMNLYNHFEVVFEEEYAANIFTSVFSSHLSVIEDMLPKNKEAAINDATTNKEEEEDLEKIYELIKKETIKRIKHTGLKFRDGVMKNAKATVAIVTNALQLRTTHTEKKNQLQWNDKTMEAYIAGTDAHKMAIVSRLPMSGNDSLKYEIYKDDLSERINYLETLLKNPQNSERLNELFQFNLDRLKNLTEYRITALDIAILKQRKRDNFLLKQLESRRPNMAVEADDTQELEDGDGAGGPYDRGDFITALTDTKKKAAEAKAAKAAKAAKTADRRSRSRSPTGGRVGGKKKKKNTKKRRKRKRQTRRKGRRKR